MTPTNVQQAANAANSAVLKDKAVQNAFTVVGLIPFGGAIADQLKSSESSRANSFIILLP
jgi:hypothetical protein